MQKSWRVYKHLCFTPKCIPLHSEINKESNKAIFFACMKIRMNRFTSDQVYQSSWRIVSASVHYGNDVTSAFTEQYMNSIMNNF